MKTDSIKNSNNNNTVLTSNSVNAMKTSVNFFEGFEYESVLKYVNKVARSFQGMLTDRSLEYDDLVSQGLMAAVNGFRKWDAKNNNDRTDTAHLEAFVKTSVCGYLRNMFKGAKNRNQLSDDEIESLIPENANTDNDDEIDMSVVEDAEEAAVVTSENDSLIDDDSDSINGKSQRKFAKVFHAGSDEDSIAMMDVASAKVAEEEDERLGALEAFILTLSGIELDIMNNMLNRSDDSIKKIADRYKMSTGCVSRKCAAIKDELKSFIENY